MQTDKDGINAWLDNVTIAAEQHARTGRAYSGSSLERDRIQAMYIAKAGRKWVLEIKDGNVSLRDLPSSPKL